MDKKLTDIDGVPATMLITVAARALAPIQRPDIGFRDLRAEQLVKDLGIDPADFCTFPGSLVSVLSRSLFFDRIIAGFLSRHPEAMVLDLACGLGTIYDRIPEALRARATWIDADLPDVIAIRRRFFADSDNREMVDSDLSDSRQLGRLLRRGKGRPTLVVMEGVLYYLEPTDVRAIFECVGAVHDQHGGVLEMTFDVTSVSGVQLANSINTDTQRVGAPMNWAYLGAAQLREWDAALEVLEVGDHLAYAPAPIREMLEQAKARDGVAPSAVLHIRRGSSRVSGAVERS